jgi:hypothetical protein
MKQFVAWKGMKSAVHDFVQSCVICQKAKPDKTKSPRLRQPHSIPNATWQNISTNFIEGLPQSRSTNCTLVVVDIFTKYDHFLPLKHPYITQSVHGSDL